VSLPASWRFVLASPAAGLGLHGTTEQSAFAKLPPVPSAVTEQLTELLCEQLLPATKSADFLEFSNAVYEFGHLAGSCFESIQGSPYNGRELQGLVEHLRASGVIGVGQSSWGPTIYSICESESSASRLVERLRSQTHTSSYDLQVAAPNNVGATVRVESCNQ
jgi:beta-ribofuranosylaminobenzene 5'-phosphate synthase